MMTRMIAILLVAALSFILSGSALAVDYEMADDADIDLYSPLHTNVRLGYSVAMGDLNNDGNDDLIVGAPDYNESGTAAPIEGAGRVFILWGGQDNGADVIIRTEGSLSFYNYNLGYALAVGDINNDMIDDLLVSAPGAENPDLGMNDAGAIFVFYGGGTWPAIWTLDPYAATSISADVNVFGPGYTRLGSKIASGDLNGDGSDEIIGSEIDAMQGGRVNVIFGGDFTPEEMLYLPGDGDVYIDNPPDMVSNFGLGNGLTAGDVSGDGIDDLLMGTPGTWNPGMHGEKIDLIGHVYVLFGQDGWPGHVDLASDGSDLDIVGVTEAEANLGYAIAVGDLNGDEIGDIMMGAPDLQSRDPIKAGSHGTVYVVYGGDFSSPQTIPLDTPTNRDVTIHGVPGEYQHFGFSIASGDMNADCVDDMIVGGWYDDNYVNRAVFVVYGSDEFEDSAILTMPEDATHRLTNDPSQDLSYLGNAVAMGDADGDALADMLVGAMRWMNGDGYGGAAFLVYSDEIYDPPMADAGPDQEANVGDTVTLDGSGSAGSDIGYAWVQTDGPAATLTGANTAGPSFMASETGAYTFELTVADCNAGDTDEMEVFVESSPDDDDTVDDDDTTDETDEADEEDMIPGFFGSGGCGLD